VNPAVADLQALLTALDVFGELCDLDLVEV
jgi:hypothetical protein